MDDTYQVYVNRLARLSAAETYQSQLPHLHESEKYQQAADGTWQAAPFPGYTIISTPWGDASHLNQGFHTALQHCQTHLVTHLPSQVFIPVPPASFHVTIADLIWGDAYQHASQDPAFDPQLQAAIAHIFAQSQAEFTTFPTWEWQSFGLILMPRAIGLGLIPTQASAYEQICQLRRSLYQSPELMGLGIEQQYNFTAHITLGYFANLPALTQLGPDWGQTLSTQLTTGNQTWLDEVGDQRLQTPAIELRKFATMAAYDRAPDWPVLTCAGTLHA